MHALQSAALRLAQPTTITRTNDASCACKSQLVAAIFAHNRCHLSTIDPISDPLAARPLHAKSRKSFLPDELQSPFLLVLVLLGACQEAPEAPAEAQQLAAEAVSGCGDDAYLSTELYGSIARKISWSAAELRCESMLRPQGKGARLRFTGTAADSQLSIILALPELQRGAGGPESPTVVTLTVEGSGRFFSTPTLESCWTDIASQDLMGDSGDLYSITGTLYCVAPLGEINGSAAISVPELSFRGIIDWSKK